MTKKKDNRPLESEIERHLKNLIERAGGLCYKFMSPGRNGVPDRIVLAEGQTYFVELKRPGEKPRPEQVKVHQDMQKRGVSVYVLDSKKAVENFVQSIGLPLITKQPSQELSDDLVKSFTIIK
mgnify:CR=1 FL=1